jgi:hypothetical protein
MRRSVNPAAGEDDFLAEQGLHPDGVLEQLSAWVGDGLIEEDRCHQRNADRPGAGADSAFPLMVPTRDVPVIPSAPAWQVLWMLLMEISPPSRLAPSTEDDAVVTPVVGFTVQLALSAPTLATPDTLSPA